MIAVMNVVVVNARERCMKTNKQSGQTKNHLRTQPPDNRDRIQRHLPPSLASQALCCKPRNGYMIISGGAACRGDVALGDFTANDGAFSLRLSKHLPCSPGAISVPTLRGMRLSGTGTLSSGMATVRNTFPGRPIQARPFVPLPRSCSLAATANTRFASLP